MKLKRHGILAGLALTATLALAACGSDNGGSSPQTGGSSGTAKFDCASGKLTAQGSSAQLNAIDQWTKAYQQQCTGATIEYTGSGSGAGITAFSLTPSLWVAFPFLLVAGFGYLASNVRATTQLQLEVDESQRGRIMALWSIAFLGLRPLASLVDGAIAGAFGVRAAGVANWDEVVSQGGWDVGIAPPMALGVEAAGVVTGVGAAVHDWAPGDEVLTHPLPLVDHGTWAPWLIADARLLVRKPAEVSWASAGAFAVPGLTAIQVLDEGLRVKPGEQLLVMERAA